MKKRNTLFIVAFIVVFGTMFILEALHRYHSGSLEGYGIGHVPWSAPFGNNVLRIREDLMLYQLVLTNPQPQGIHAQVAHFT